MTTRSRRTSLALVMAFVLSCRGPDVRTVDTAVAQPVAASTAGDTAFMPADTSAAPTPPDTQPTPPAVPKKPAVTKAPAVRTAPVAKPPVEVATVQQDTQRAVSDTVPAVVIPAPPVPVVKAPEPVVPAVKDTSPTLPFAAGERLEYQVKFGSISVGSATLEVIGMDTIRGIPAMHIVMRVKGSLGFVGVNDRYESWFDPRTMSSLRYVQDIDEATYERVRHYEIYPERKTYHEKGKKELPSVSAPLDDASFLFFMRSIPLALGQSYSFDRYFKPDRNPVRVVVLRKEKIKVPAGTFSAVVVRPIIKTTGLFSEGGRAEVWFSDDDARLLVQMKTQMKIGSLNLFLRKVRRAPVTTPAVSTP